MQKALLYGIGFISVLLIAGSVSLSVLTSQKIVSEQGRALGAATQISPTSEPLPTVIPTEVPVQEEATVLAQEEGLSNPTPLRKTVTVFNRKDLQTLWYILYGSKTAAPPLPQVNFTKNAVIAVLAGQQPSGGYKISYAGLQEEATETTVQFNEIVPGENCKTAAVMSSPFILVQVPNTGKTFKTVFNTQQSPCN